MKVKANYSIICNKGSIRTGETFEIDENELPMYGDAVEVVERSAAPAKPAEEVKPEEPAEEAPVAEEPAAEKPKTSTRRKKTSESK